MKRLSLTGSLLLFFVVLSNAQSSSKPVEPSKTVLERGKKVYDLYCLACHQADGSGVPNMNPPLIKTKWVLGEKPVLIQVLLKGMDEEIEVNGETFHNVMAPHDHLSDQEIADVLTYVRNNFGNKASVITPEEVKRERNR